jgi:hypothetical protein
MKAPLTDPTAILQKMPTQAISPALLELLELLSSPIFLTETSPSGEPIPFPAISALMEAA